MRWAIHYSLQDAPHYLAFIYSIQERFVWIIPYFIKDIHCNYQRTNALCKYNLLKCSEWMFSFHNQAKQCVKWFAQSIRDCLIIFVTRSCEGFPLFNNQKSILCISPIVHAMFSIWKRLIAILNKLFRSYDKIQSNYVWVLIRKCERFCVVIMYCELCNFVEN